MSRSKGGSRGDGGTTPGTTRGQHGMVHPVTKPVPACGAARGQHVRDALCAREGCDAEYVIYLIY